MVQDIYLGKWKRKNKRQQVISLTTLERSWKYCQFLQMDEKSSLTKSNMPETDQKSGEQLTEHSRTLGMILRRELKKKKIRESYMLSSIRNNFKICEVWKKQSYTTARGKVNSQ